MKRILCVVLLVFLPGSAFAGSQADQAGTLTFLVGEVFLKRGDQDWCKAEFDMALHAGDEIETGADSRCEITLVTGSVIRMDQNTVQALDKVRVEKEARDVSLFVGAGRLWLNARKIVSKQDTFKVRTDKTVCAIRGTRLGVDTSRDATRIAVYEGEAEVRASRDALRSLDAERSSEGHVEQPVPVPGPRPVTMKEWVEIVRSLQQITVDAQGQYHKSGLDLEAESRDPWVIWNRERDQLSSRFP
jgi:hypothetical protein